MSNPRRAPHLLLVMAGVLLILSGSVLAGERVTTRVLSDDGERTVVELLFPEPEVRDVFVRGERFETLSYPGEAVNLERGAPQLPRVARSVIIPDATAMSVRVLAIDFEERQARVAPSKGNFKRSVDPATVPVSFGPAYEKNAFYPERLAELGQPYVMRNYRGIAFTVHPLQYNPVSGTLRIHRRITLELRATRGAVQNARDTDDIARSDKPFRSVYSSRFLNYRERKTRYPAIDEEGRMLILCHDEWTSRMADFVTHKASAGITAEVVPISTVGNSAAQIKTYVQNYYNDNDLAYLLLVGDAAQVATPQASGGASDPSYAKLAGSDNYPDILVGRFSARNAAEVDTQVQRTIEYETSHATTMDWFKKGTGIASDEGGPGNGDEDQSDIVHMDEIRGWLLGDAYTEVDKIYDPGATSSSVASALNAGRGVVNYVGHGDPTSWVTSGFSVSDIDALTNDDKLPFIVSVACNNGEFDNYENCFGEAWLRATNGDEPTGAIAVYASSISQDWSPPMEGQDEFNIQLTKADGTYKSFGALCFAGSSSMMDSYGSTDGSSGVNMYNTWHIFGDPSVRVEGTIGPPTGLGVTPGGGLNASGPAGGPYDITTLTYTLHNYETSAIDYTVGVNAPWVTLSKTGGTLAASAETEVVVTLSDATRNFDHGTHAATVTFTNTTNHDGDTTRAVSVEVGRSLRLVSESFDADPAWTKDGEWAFGAPQGQGGGTTGSPDPSAGATGSNVYGVNLAGDYSTTISGPYTLTSAEFDLTGIDGSELGFQRWLNSDEPSWVRNKVEISVDGSTWTELWNGSATDNAWQKQNFDIASVADGQANVRFRWSYEVHNSGAYAASGWNVDDIEVLGTPASGRIRLTMTGSALSWSAYPGASAYDLQRGNLAQLKSSGGDFSASTESCLADSQAERSFTDAATPSSGDGYWYLVRAVAGGENETYQSLASSQQGVRDEEIGSASGRCP